VDSPVYQSASGWRVTPLARSFLLSLEAKTELKGRSFVPPIANLKAAHTLALDDDLAVQRAQFDLANVAASGIDLLRNQGRALGASARFARRNIAASVDANGRGSGIEIRLKHPLIRGLPLASANRKFRGDARSPNGSSLIPAARIVRWGCMSTGWHLWFARRY
jgi:hypothetical protein